MMILFNLYSWVTNILWIFLDILPPGFRKIIFKLTLSEFGAGSTIDYRTYIRYPSKVRIGSGTTINRGCSFLPSQHFKNVGIYIGNHVAVAPEVQFIAVGHDYTSKQLPVTAADIHVGDYVWIGTRSMIMQGVTIGEGSVIAAGSIVTKDIPPYSVAAGVPARVIKKREIKEENQ